MRIHSNSFFTSLSTAAIFTILSLFLPTGSLSAKLVEKHEEAVQQYEEADKENPPLPGSTFFIGSSTFTRWKSIPEDFSDWYAVNRGFGGSTTSDWLEAADRLVTPYDPARIVFWCGGNDVSRKAEPKDVFANIQKIVEILRVKNAELPIHICLLPHTPKNPKNWPKNDEVNSLLTEWAKTAPNIHIVDYLPAVLDESGAPHADLYEEDGRHFNQKGNAVLKEFIQNSLFEAGPPKPRLPRMPKQHVCHIGTGPDNPRNSEGDFLRQRNGDILYIYTHYYGNTGNDNDPAYLASRRSSDNGSTWTEEDEVVLPNEGKLNVMSVSLRRLADGRPVLFYLVDEHDADCRPYMRISEDDGNTWGERISIIPEESYNVVNNDRILIQENGRIIMPVALHHRDKKTGAMRFEVPAQVFCLISDDNGKTWKKSAVVSNENNVLYQEPGLCPLEDGRILMYIRTNAKSQFLAYSSDNGETWTKPEPSVLDSPLSPMLIKRIPGSGDLVAVRNKLRNGIVDALGGRRIVSVSRLTPDGTRILSEKLLEWPDCDPIQSWQYPAILFVDDDTFLCAYFAWCDGVDIYKMKISNLEN